MSSGMFRGKESSNRIEISRLVQDLLNFGVLGSLWLWGGDKWVGGVWGHGDIPTCMYIHAHVHTHTWTCIHVKKLQMVTPMETSMFIMFTTCMCMHACACVCACMYGTPHTHPYPIHPPTTPQEDPQNQ